MSITYFDFLGSVWEYLPEQDKVFAGELWRAYEQVIASSYQKFVELDLNINNQDLQPWSTELWLPYTFDPANLVKRRAFYTSTQDMAQGADTTDLHLLAFRVDGGTPFEVDIRPVLDANKTPLTHIIQAINDAAGYKFAYSTFEGTILQLVSPTLGLDSKIEILPTSDPAANACEIILGLMAENLPAVYPEYPYVFALPYQFVAGIPQLRDAIRDETVSEILLEGTDYVLNSVGEITFRQLPSKEMRAPKTHFNTENPWNNFGFLVDIYQPNSERYVGVIQGLWFAFWTGAKPENVKRSLYLLFGLPTSRSIGVVSRLTTTEIDITSADEVVTYQIPSGLEAIVTLGQTVDRFQPLVSGIDVWDKINKPGFVESEIGRAGIQRYLTDSATRGTGPDTDETKAMRMLEEYTFLPQIQVESFIHPDIDLKSVKAFLNAIKPLNKTYMFQIIVGDFADDLGLKDRFAVALRMNVTPNTDSNQTTFADPALLAAYETTDNPDCNLDSDGLLFQEVVAIEVRNHGSVVDDFIA